MIEVCLHFLPGKCSAVVCMSFFCFGVIGSVPISGDLPHPATLPQPEFSEVFFGEAGRVRDDGRKRPDTLRQIVPKLHAKVRKKLRTLRFSHNFFLLLQVIR